MLSMITPFYAGSIGYGYDPSYAYLFNGVELFEGYAPVLVYHPGTPLETLIGIVTWLAWLYEWLGGQTTLTFGRAAVEDPEHYIFIVSLLLLFMNAVATMYLGIRVKAATQSLSMALIAQSGVAFLGALSPYLAYLAPEALVMFAGIMVMACLSDTLLSFSPLSEPTSDRSAVAVGFFLALGVTAKIDFAPLILLLAVMPTKRARIIGLLALLGFSLLFLLPIITKLPEVVKWYYGLTTHTGYYGSGPEGLVDIAAVPARLSTLFHRGGLVFAAAAACIVAVTMCIFGIVDVNRSSHRRWCVWVGAVLFAILAIQVALVLKHFRVHYILPSFVISSVILIRPLRLLEARFARPARVLATIAAAGIIVFAVVQGYENIKMFSVAKKVRDSQLATLQQTLDANHDAMVIASYPAMDSLYALEFGLQSANLKFAMLTAGKKAESLSYNRWAERLQRLDGTLLEVSYLNKLIAQGRKILMILPPDVKIPTLEAEVLAEIPGRERILKVLHVQ